MWGGVPSLLASRMIRQVKEIMRSFTTSWSKSTTCLNCLSAWMCIKFFSSSSRGWSIMTEFKQCWFSMAAIPTQWWLCKCLSNFWTWAWWLAPLIALTIRSSCKTTLPTNKWTSYSLLQKETLLQDAWRSLMVLGTTWSLTSARRWLRWSDKSSSLPVSMEW